MSFRSSTKENGHWRKRKNPFILLLVVDTFAHLFAAVLTPRRRRRHHQTVRNE